MKFLGKKIYGNNYLPADDLAFEKSVKVPMDGLVVMEYIEGRNYKFLQKFMVLMNITFYHLPEQFKYIRNETQLRKILVVEAGYYTLLTDLHGNTIKEPMSISYESIPNDELFGQIYSDVLNVILQYFEFDQDFIEKHLTGFL